MRFDFVCLLNNQVIRPVVPNPQTVHNFAPSMELGGSKNVDCLMVFNDWVGKHWIRQ